MAPPPPARTWTRTWTTRRLLAGAAVVAPTVALAALAVTVARTALASLAAGRPAGVEDVVPLVASAAAAAVMTWWALAWAAVATLGLARRAGRRGPWLDRADRLTARWTPALLRRAASAALGVAIAGGTAAPALAAPTGAATVASAPLTAGRASVTDPLAWPPTATTPAAPATPTTQTTPTTTVVVRPGDTLWGITARTLPGRPTAAAVATQWPHWWAANRAVIGADPDLLRPGQVLSAPPAS